MHSYVKAAALQASLVCWLALCAGGAVAGTDDSGDRGFRPLAADGGKADYKRGVADTGGASVAGNRPSGLVPSPIVTSVGVERRADGTLRGFCHVLPRNEAQRSLLRSAGDTADEGGR